MLSLNSGVARDLHFRSPACWSAGCRGSPAVAANPDVPLVIHGDSVVRLRPVVALARAAPVPDEVALLIELEDRRRRPQHCSSRADSLWRAVLRFERARPMNDPD